MKSFKDFGIKPSSESFVGEKIKMDKILNTKIIVHKYKIEKSTKRENTQCLYLQIEVDGVKRILFSGSSVLIYTIQRVPTTDFPFETKIIKENEHFEFS